jgi:fructoselysine-6-P-deglycase FrlB-like protein
MRTSGLWLDVLEMPEALQRTLDANTGVKDAIAVLRDPSVRRVIATGNGAAYYVAFAIALAALESSTGPELVALPAGVVADPRFAWREGDRLLAISSSGEFKDVVRAIEQGAPKPVVAITAHADSTLGRLADAVALQTVLNQRAITHTQALAGALAIGLRIWGGVTGDSALARIADAGPAALAAAIATSADWAESAFGAASLPVAAASFGGGPAWSSALETALLLKEISRIPAEGAETREGATSVMYGLNPQHLVLALETTGDPGFAEAVDVCRATGANVVVVPGGTGVDRRFAFATLLPATSAASGVLANLGGHDIDNPTWIGAYYATARASGTETP